MSDFGFFGRKKAEQFLEQFEDTYYLRQLRILGDSIRWAGHIGYRGIGYTVSHDPIVSGGARHGASCLSPILTTWKCRLFTMVHNPTQQSAQPNLFSSFFLQLFISTFSYVLSIHPHPLCTMLWKYAVSFVRYGIGQRWLYNNTVQRRSPICKRRRSPSKRQYS